MTAPKTLRELYERDLNSYFEERELLKGALMQLSSGQTASYSIGNRSVTYINMKDLNDRRAFVDEQIADLIAILSGRPIRCVQAHSYASPAIVQPPFINYNNQ